jgi:hypothetical protein
MATGTLTGYAISIAALPMWDHTYVTSSHGHVWGCWGRSRGGTVFCSGGGNIDKANCLSQPASQAGISYGNTGVCHQTANRILLEAGQMVSGARGYRASVFMWGVYSKEPSTGRHYSPPSFPWPELSVCNATHVHP